MKNQKFNNYTLYNALLMNYINMFKNDINQNTYKLLNEWLDNINIIIKYMLYDRFQPSVKKLKSTRNISGDLRQLLIKQGKIILTPAEVQPNLLDVIKFFKLLENYILTKKDRIEDIKVLKLGKFNTIALDIYDTLPKLLLEVKLSVSATEKNLLTLIFSVITSYRQFKVSAVFDSSTITSEYSGNRMISEILDNEFSHANVNKWLDTIENFDEIKNYAKLLMYCGNASSPSGGASGINILNDVAALNSDSRLYNAAISLAANFEGFDVFNTLVSAISRNVVAEATKPSYDLTDFTYKEGVKHSKVFTFTAPGGKARIIAMADWVSQTALSAIHFSLFKLLTLIKSDTTFNHASGLDLYQEDAKSFISVDLSAATDRLPRELQARILECIFTKISLDGESIALNWLQLMNRPFSTEASAFEKESLTLNYSVGQGMGLFSSWVSLAICHHYIVNSVSNIQIDNYKLVGDDLLLKDSEDEYNTYIEFMNSIGMKINQSKTILSMKHPHTIEYARNYIIDGHSIIPLPLGTALAWLKDQVPTETLIWSHRLILNHDYLIRLIEILEGRVLHHKLLIMIYYFKKNNIVSDKDILLLLKRDSRLNKITLDVLNSIIEITKTDRNTWHLSGVGDFYSSVKSACVMRKDEELTKACILAESISLLRYTDDSLVNAANNLFWRLTNANLIAFTPEVSGGPITTRRERSLLVEYLASA